MNSNDLLAQFRSNVPLPDEATAQRIYARSTSGRSGSGWRRPVIAVVAAAVAALAAAGVLSETHGGRPRPVSTSHGDMFFAHVRPSFTADGNRFTAVALNFPSDAEGATAQITVERSDALQVPEAYHAPSETVFQENVPIGAERTVTLPTSDWHGGCQHALYRISFVWSGASDATAWFECKGADANPADPFPNSFSG